MPTRQVGGLIHKTSTITQDSMEHMTNLGVHVKIAIQKEDK